MVPLLLSFLFWLVALAVVLGLNPFRRKRRLPPGLSVSEALERARRRDRP